MTKEALELALTFEKLGIIGVLVVMLIMFGWVIRHLYKEKSESDAITIKLTADVGEVRGEVKAMSAKLDADVAGREHHKKDMERLHKSVLEAVVLK